MNRQFQWFNGLMTTRTRRVEREGSEFFTWKPGATVAGATINIELAAEFPRCRKYLPLSFIEVANNDPSCDLTLLINQSENLPVPRSTIRTVRRPGIWQIGIKNEDAAISTTADKIVVSLRRDAKTADDAARENV